MLKDMIRNSVGGLDTLAEHFDSMWRIQTYNIKGKLEESRCKIPTEILKGDEWVKSLFKRLLCKVSCECLRILYKQALLVKGGKYDGEECQDPWWRKSLGLPCPHRLKEYMDRVLPLKPSEIHIFWKQLKWERKVGPKDLSVDDDTILTGPYLEMTELVTEFQSGNMNHDLMFNLTTKRRDFVAPCTSTLQEPPVGRTAKGRPKGKKNSTTRNPSLFEHKAEERRKRTEANQSSVGAQNCRSAAKGKKKLVQSVIYLDFDWGKDNVDKFMLSCIRMVTDVLADGNCGYRSLVVLLGHGEDMYSDMRQVLAQELHIRHILYTPASLVTPLHTLISNVSHQSAPCREEFWMEVPMVGLAFATRFQVALVVLSWSGPHTCLPMCAPLAFYPQLRCTQLH